MTDAGIAAICTHCSQLTSLNLGCVRSVSAGAVSALCDILPIIDLELGGTSIREADMVSLFGRYLELDDESGGAC